MRPRQRELTRLFFKMSNILLWISGVRVRSVAGIATDMFVSLKTIIGRRRNDFVWMSHLCPVLPVGLTTLKGKE